MLFDTNEMNHSRCQNQAKSSSRRRWSQLFNGIRQSMPESQIAKLRLEIVMTPSATEGQRNHPRSSRFENKHKPWPLCQNHLMTPPRRQRNRKRSPA
jgi:hypothetical protein